MIGNSIKDKSGVAKTCFGRWKPGRCEAASVLDNGALRRYCTEVRLALAMRGNELTKYNGARKWSLSRSLRLCKVSEVCVDVGCIVRGTRNGREINGDVLADTGIVPHLHALIAGTSCMPIQRFVPSTTRSFGVLDNPNSKIYQSRTSKHSLCSHTSRKYGHKRPRQHSPSPSILPHL